MWKITERWCFSVTWVVAFHGARAARSALLAAGGVVRTPCCGVPLTGYCPPCGWWGLCGVWNTPVFVPPPHTQRVCSCVRVRACVCVCARMHMCACDHASEKVSPSRLGGGFQEGGRLIMTCSLLLAQPITCGLSFPLCVCPCAITWNLCQCHELSSQRSHCLSHTQVHLMGGANLLCLASLRA